MKKIVAVLLLLAMAMGTLGALAETPKAGSVAINSTNFPDKTLRNYVKKNFDTNRNGKLSAKERNAVKKITLFKESYYDKGKEPPTCKTLKGIEYFPNLEALYCDFCEVEKLDVTKNTKLVTLCCSWNKLKKLNVSKNTSLVALYAGRTGIKKLDIKNNKKLQKCLNGKAEINGWLDEDEETIYWGVNVEATGVERGVLINRTTVLTSGSKTLYKGNK